MGFFMRCMLCLMVIAAHWANAGHDMVFEGPYDSNPVVDQMRRPVLVPKPVYRNPRLQPFPLMKPQDPHVPSPILHPFYPMYPPNMLPAHYPHPWPHHGLVPSYWVEVPNPWYLQGLQQGPPYPFPNPAMQPPKAHVLTEKTVKPEQEEPDVVESEEVEVKVQFVKPTDVKGGGYVWKEVKPQVPKYHGVKGGPAVYQAEPSGLMSDLPFVPRLPQHLLMPHVPRYYYVRPGQQWIPPPQKPNYIKPGRPVLQKKMLPRLEWSWKRGHWVPKFE